MFAGSDFVSMIATIENVQKQIEEQLNELTTEQKAFEALQKLAIERIRKVQYDKAAKVLNALQILSN